jgi:hypothetical protein
MTVGGADARKTMPLERVLPQPWCRAWEKGRGVDGVLLRVRKGGRQCSRQGVCVYKKEREREVVVKFIADHVMTERERLLHV